MSIAGPSNLQDPLQIPGEVAGFWAASSGRSKTRWLRPRFRSKPQRYWSRFIELDILAETCTTVLTPDSSIEKQRWKIRRFVWFYPSCFARLILPLMPGLRNDPLASGAKPNGFRYVYGTRDGPLKRSCKHVRSIQLAKKLVSCSWQIRGSRDKGSIEQLPLAVLAGVLPGFLQAVWLIDSTTMFGRSSGYEF